MMTEPSRIEYRTGPSSLSAEAFLDLANRVWPREYALHRIAEALTRTINVSAWQGERLVGVARVLSDGYLFNVVSEVLVDPEFRCQGIGRALMHQALRAAPGGRVFFGAQPGNEAFFEKIGFTRGPVGFVGRVEDVIKPKPV